MQNDLHSIHETPGQGVVFTATASGVRKSSVYTVSDQTQRMMEIRWGHGKTRKVGRLSSKFGVSSTSNLVESKLSFYSGGWESSFPSKVLQGVEIRRGGKRLREGFNS